jgi:phenylacetate-CoA ligase
MGLYTKLVAGLIFPLQERLKKHSTVAVRRELERTQWSSPAELEQLQVQRLRRLLILAGKHVPHYRALFAGLNFDPTQVNSLAALRRLPRTTKQDIRAAGDTLKSEHAHGLARFNTGGSSGEPLIFFIGKERVSHDVAAKWRATRWWGVDIGDPEIVVWGSPIEVGSQDRVKAVRDALMRTQLLPAFEMSEARLDEFLAVIRRVRPRMLFGYPSALSLIAQHAQRRGVSMDDLGIAVAFVTSERLYDDQRECIGKVFGCRVANGYGGRDAGFIAHECPAGSLHITAEDVIVELLDESGEPVRTGQVGEIVVTHLATPDFPFIRYRTGDMGVQSGKACACGRGLPVLDEVQGRSTDFVVAQDGTVMHGLALIYVLRDLPGVGAFKIVQHTLDHTEVLVVPGQGWSDAHPDTIVRGLQARLGQGVSISVQQVDQIPPEKSGKFRYIVSHAR